MLVSEHLCITMCVHRGVLCTLRNQEEDVPEGGD
jgi:hypothetical protein